MSTVTETRAFVKMCRDEKGEGWSNAQREQLIKIAGISEPYESDEILIELAILRIDILEARARAARRDATILRWEKCFNSMGVAFDTTIVELHALCVAILGKDPNTSEEYELAMKEAAILREEVERLKTGQEAQYQARLHTGVEATKIISELELQLTTCRQQLRQVDAFLASREMAAKGGTDYKTALHELVCMEVDQAVSDCQQKLVTAREVLGTIPNILRSLTVGTVLVSENEVWERVSKRETVLRLVCRALATLDTADSSQAGATKL